MNQKYNIYLRKDGRYEGRIPIGRKPDGRLRYRSIYHHDKKKLKLILEAEAQKEINVRKCFRVLQAEFTLTVITLVLCD